MSERFGDFAKFLEYTSDDDREFLGNHELDKIPETLCALENSSGGWIVAGAFYDETGELIITGLDESIRPHTLFAGYESECEVFDYHTARIIAAHVKSLSRYEKPKILEGKVYRRVEGVNVISGKFARSIIASDSLNYSRDDYAVDDSNINLDTKSINEFRASITKYNFLSEQEFLRQTFIYSGKHLTFAGALMFGNILQVSAELHHSGKIFSREAYNIWQAYSDLIPRLTCRLSSSCSEAVRAALLNSLLHADYNIDRHIHISIIANPPRIIINNPGIICDSESIRNYRLYKIFELAGISHGMNIIKSYQPNFRLVQDFAEFRVIAEIMLEGSNSLPAPVIL